MTAQPPFTLQNNNTAIHQKYQHRNQSHNGIITIHLTNHNVATLAKLQRQAATLIPSVTGLSYNDRSRAYGLQSLEWQGYSNRSYVYGLQSLEWQGYNDRP